ncbi:Protein of unknown function [Gryllus bimaculatus]|nr:Protein of unknown function [Gryllus bimaculatus]
MDGQEIVLSESLLKVEEIKEEPEELLEEVDPIEVQETSTSEDVVKEETDDGEVQEASTSKDVLIKEADEQQELEPLAAVFVEALKEEVEEEYKKGKRFISAYKEVVLKMQEEQHKFQMEREESEAKRTGGKKNLSN